MTRTILTAALAAFLVGAFGATAHAGAAPPKPPAAAEQRGQSKCDSITDPVKKQECMKQESERQGVPRN